MGSFKSERFVKGPIFVLARHSFHGSRVRLSSFFENGYKRSMNKLLIFITIMSLEAFAAPVQPVGPSGISLATTEEVAQVLRQAANSILSEQKPGGFWLYPSNIGAMYSSQYYIMSHWLGVEKRSAVNTETLKNHILSKQLPDGSWELMHDANFPEGNINAAIYNYWALKIMGFSTDAPPMVKARNFILKSGGLTKATLFTRVFLSLFNNLNWEDYPAIPYLAFKSWSPANTNEFAQWVGPHTAAIAYLQKKRVFKNFGPRFHLDELRLSSSGFKSMEQTLIPGDDDLEQLRVVLSNQKYYGSFGGYTPATQLSMAVMQHVLTYAGANITPELRRRLKASFEEGFKFLEEMSFKNPDGAYRGVACDGRYWDTVLVGQGLLEAGIPADKLVPGVRYISKLQNKNSGGFGFGLDFENYEDTDDTAESLLFFKKAGFESTKNQKAIQWLLKMQNTDGGWGAFAKDNTGNFLLEMLTNDYLDSADLFDESSTDVTGHILEALGAFGYTYSNSEAVRRAVEYLRQQQKPSFGGWEARWGVNYIYGTAATVIGLIDVGISAQDPMIRRALDWLESCPNKFDGGFGESFKSYKFENLKCGGRSTPSQTAWAMMALIAGGRAHSPVVAGAATYLTRKYQQEGQWVDASFVGTGHPKIVPMDYPVYPKSFTLMALGRYLKEIKK